MRSSKRFSPATVLLSPVLVAAALLLAAGCTLTSPKSGSSTAASSGGMEAHRTAEFHGVKVNSGTVAHTREAGRSVLTLSDDFKVPDTPAPHWQVVSTNGDVHLLNRLVIKGDKFNKTITVPPHIHDIAKVQIWCAWAETLLGEASFPSPVK